MGGTQRSKRRGRSGAPSVSDVARLDRVAKVAANAIGEAVEDRTTLGIAWGTTIDAVAAHLLALADPAARH